MRKLLILSALACLVVRAVDYPAAALADGHPLMSAKVKALIRREQSLDDRCRAPGADPNGRICTLRYYADQHLEHLGWCWGDKKIDAIEEAYHWMRCSKVRTVP